MDTNFDNQKENHRAVTGQPNDDSQPIQDAGSEQISSDAEAVRQPTPLDACSMRFERPAHLKPEPYDPDVAHTTYSPRDMLVPPLGYPAGVTAETWDAYLAESLSNENVEVEVTPTHYIMRHKNREESNGSYVTGSAGAGDEFYDEQDEENSCPYTPPKEDTYSKWKAFLKRLFPSKAPELS